MLEKLKLKAALSKYNVFLYVSTVTLLWHLYTVDERKKRALGPIWLAYIRHKLFHTHAVFAEATKESEAFGGCARRTFLC